MARRWLRGVQYTVLSIEAVHVADVHLMLA